MVTYGLLALALLVCLFISSVIAVGLLLISVPASYFQDRHQRRLWVDRHPLTRLLLHLVKNLIGGGIVVAGCVFLVLGIPGQAVVTILLGVMLLDFPGKVRLERRLVRSPGLLNRVNRLRERFGRAPLEIDEPLAMPTPSCPVTGVRLDDAPQSVSSI